MRREIFRGAATALITPFRDGKIDYSALEEIIEMQIKAGIAALVICGTTGEAATLTEEEHLSCIRFAVDIVKGRVPVIAGTGSNATDTAIEMGQAAASIGSDALLVVTPYYNKPTQSGIIKHYYAIADSCEKPIIAYNVPSRTGTNILPETAYQLSLHDNIRGIKEASGDIAATAKIRSLCGDEFAVYSGNDDSITPILSLGGSGVISVLSNILPAEVQQLCTSYFHGEVKESAALQLKYLNLIGLLFSASNPIPVKAAMSLMGLCLNELRLPLDKLDEALMQKLKAEMTRLAIL